MRTAVIKEGDILPDHPSNMPLAEDQDMIQAFAPNTAKKAFTQRIGTRCLERGMEQFNVSTRDGPFKQQPILVIIVANQKAWPNPEAGRLAHLLRYPRVAWTAADCH